MILFPNKKYSIIYVDPPWSYYNDSNASPNCTTVKGMRRPPYNVLSSKEIINLPVKEITEDNCILFIWTTDYHMRKCMNVIEAWRFEYKTVGFAWQKKNKNNTPVCFTGKYTMKSGIELCLLATKGRNAHKLIKNHKVRALINEQRSKHSEKPNEVRTRIVELLGDLPRIKLFARQQTEGWNTWGNNLELDVGDN